MNDGPKELSISPIVRGEERAAAELFAQLRIPVAGSTSSGLQRAIIAESLRNPGVVLVLARGGSELLGLGLAVIDPRRFWRMFVLRQPGLALARVKTLLRRKRGGGASAATPDAPECRALLSPASGRHWGESGPQIAHVLIVNLLPEARGTGLGPQLFAALLDELARRGVRRFDSRIAKTNVVSVRMCHRMGIAVEDAPGTFFVTADLPWRPSGQPR